MENERQQKIDSVRRFCDFLESHPEFNLPSVFSDKFNVFVDGKEAFTAHVRMLGSGSKSADSTFFRFTRDFGASVNVELIEYRAAICERVIVGTRETETEEVDPIAIASLPKVKIKRTEEIVEWRCPEAILAVEAA